MLTIDVFDDDAGGYWTSQSVIEEQRRAVMALNRTAEKAVSDIKADMPRRFTLRNNWVQKRIRFDRASIRNPVARVYSLDEYMVKQEEGSSAS